MFKVLFAHATRDGQTLGVEAAARVLSRKGEPETRLYTLTLDDYESFGGLKSWRESGQGGFDKSGGVYSGGYDRKLTPEEKAALITTAGYSF